jgi:hypothetical protein
MVPFSHSPAPAPPVTCRVRRVGSRVARASRRRAADGRRGGALRAEEARPPGRAGLVGVAGAGEAELAGRGGGHGHVVVARVAQAVGLDDGGDAGGGAALRARLAGRGAHDGLVLAGLPRGCGSAQSRFARSRE